jgi:hypothetical protein
MYWVVHNFHFLLSAREVREKDVWALANRMEGKIDLKDN